MSSGQMSSGWVESGRTERYLEPVHGPLVLLGHVDLPFHEIAPRANVGGGLVGLSRATLLRIPFIFPGLTTRAHESLLDVPGKGFGLVFRFPG